MRFSLPTCLLGGAAQLSLVLAKPVVQLVDRAASPDVVTGVMQDSSSGSPAAIVVHDVNGKPSWKWTSANAAAQGVSNQLQKCLTWDAYWMPEVKWAANGRSILAIYHGAVVMINHHPGESSDGKITFGKCILPSMRNSHTAELLPGHKVAVATTDDANSKDSIRIYDLAAGLKDDIQPVQVLTGTVAVHGLIWDRQDITLWAAGNDGNPEHAGSKPQLSAYKWDDKKGLFGQTSPTNSYHLSPGYQLTTEWDGSSHQDWAEWSEGSHDVTGIPNQRKLLVATDLDLYVFDLATRKIEHGQDVVNKYVPGFAPIDNRVGKNGHRISQSDIKSVSLASNGDFIYVQAPWQGPAQGYQVNRVSGGKLQSPMKFSGQMYRSRWFQDIPGWPKAKY